MKMTTLAVCFFILFLLFGLSACMAPSPGEKKDEPTAVGIVTAFQSDGIDGLKVVSYTASTDENKLLGRPGQYVQKVNWGDPLIEDSDTLVNAGTIEVFKTEEDAKSRYDYISEMTKDSPILQQYMYLDGKYLMRLSLEFPPEAAAAYEDSFLLTLHPKS